MADVICQLCSWRMKQLPSYADVLGSCLRNQCLFWGISWLTFLLKTQLQSTWAFTKKSVYRSIRVFENILGAEESIKKTQQGFITYLFLTRSKFISSNFSCNISLLCLHLYVFNNSPFLLLSDVTNGKRKCFPFQQKWLQFFCAAKALEGVRSLLIKDKLISWFWLTVANLVQIKINRGMLLLLALGGVFVHFFNFFFGYQHQ